VAAAFASCGLFYFPARVWANPAFPGLTGVFFSVADLAVCRPLFGLRPCRAVFVPTRISVRRKCGGYAVAFAAIALDAEVNIKAAMGRRFERDAHFADAGVAAQT